SSGNGTEHKSLPEETMKPFTCSIRALLILSFSWLVAAANAYANDNLALNKPVTSSSNENASLTAEMAVDGLTNSRWSSSFSDNQWIAVDLGEVYDISQVRLHWQNSYGREYLIQTSIDGVEWTTVFTETNGNGGLDDLSLNGQGRYLRMFGQKRFT